MRLPRGLELQGKYFGSLRTVTSILLLSIAIGCKDPSDPVELDLVPPARIADLRVVEVTHASVTLAWTATGDDASAGTASDYDVRVASVPFDASTWASAERFVPTPLPAAAGTPQQLRIPLLLHNRTYYFAIRALDNFFNESPISDLVMSTTQSFGLATTIASQLTVPRGIAVDDSGNVYIADTLNNLIRKYSSSGDSLGSWGSAGTGLGQFDQPHGVAFGNDMLYVTDTFNQRVQMFARDGTPLFEWGEDGVGDGMFRRPVGIAIDPEGDVYVTDVVRERVQRFDRRGRFRAGWGMSGAGSGAFRDAVGIAADAAGNVFVLDQLNQRIQVFTRDGVFVRRWGRQGAQNGEFGVPTGIAVDADGAVYVTDEARNDFQKFTPSGAWLGTWRAGFANATRPSAIAVSPHGNAHVVYIDASFISVFGPPFAPDHPAE